MKTGIKIIVAGSVMLMLLLPCSSVLSEEAGGGMIDLETMLSTPDGDVESLPPMPQGLAEEEKTIYEIYRRLLGRNPDGQGLKDWLEHMRQNGAESVEEAIKKSDEYQIGEMYRELLGRNPERDGVEMWLSEIKNGNHSLASVRESILNSPEYLARQSGNEDGEQTADSPQSGNDNGSQDTQQPDETPENPPVSSPEEQPSEEVVEQPSEPETPPATTEEPAPAQPEPPKTEFENILAEIGIPNFLDKNTPNYDSAIRAGKEMMKKSWNDATVFQPFFTDIRKYIPTLQRNLKREQEWYEKMVRDNQTSPFLLVGDTIQSAGEKVKRERKKLEDAWASLKEALKAADAEAVKQQNSLVSAVRSLERMQENLAALGDPNDSSTASQRQSLVKNIKDLEKQIEEINKKLSNYRTLKAAFKV
ncbi:MAG: DUF4214 domain-containing protein [Candidatus Riflebacteria bacterium]